jgi:hypothetical protein
VRIWTTTLGCTEIQTTEDCPTCDGAGQILGPSTAEVALGGRASKRCREVLANVAAGQADLMLIRDVSRLSENCDQLQELINEYRHRIAISRDDADQFR